MIYVSLKEFKKINKVFYERELKEKATIFYGQTATEKKFTAVEKIGTTITKYAELFRDEVYDSKKSKEFKDTSKSLAKVLREGKIIIRKGQKGFVKNIGIKNIFNRYTNMIDKIEKGQITSEKQMLTFFTRIYDYADYTIGIFLN